MDYSNRTVQPAAAPAHGSAVGGPSKKRKDDNMWSRIGVVVAGAAVTILVVGLVALIALGGDKQESKNIDASKLQAVFLNTGQVYFGDIESLNSKYLTLTNIYYLQTSNTGAEGTAGANVSLVKLGCELHQPYDKMIINRDQVTFWENLHDKGQVATAVSTFKQQNPDGQKCADQSSSAPTNSGSSTQPANNGNTGAGAGAGANSTNP